jgi:F-type H+-transporting ATPase subunit b
MKIDLIAMVFQILNFSIFAGALWFLLSKPVKKVLTERSQKIQEGQKAAEQAMANAAESEKLREKILKEAKAQAKQEMDALKADIAAKQTALLQEAREQAKVEKEKMLKIFVQEQKTEMDAMRAEFTAAVVKVSEAVSGAAIDAKQHAKLIEKGLEQIAHA